MLYTKRAGPRRVGHFEAVLPNLKTPICSGGHDVFSSKTGNDLETLVRTVEAGMCAIEGGMQADEESWICKDLQTWALL